MINILYFDIEGGWGGSSRSLYYLLKNIDRNKYNPIIISGKPGPIHEKYNNIGIKTFVSLNLPRIIPLKNSTWKVILRFFYNFSKSFKLWQLIKELDKKYNFKIIHYNHSSLFALAIIIKLFQKKKVFFHIRTRPFKNIWFRLQGYSISKIADYIFYISKNELSWWTETNQELSNVPYRIIHNLSEFKPFDLVSSWENNVKDKFKIVSLSNIGAKRGIDLCIDIALELKRRNVDNIVFLICGNTNTEQSQQYALKMQEDIRNSGLDSYFLWLGHQSIPEAVLYKSDALIRLARDRTPWGRDVIEAITYGKPVLALGFNETFIHNGVNGFLFEEFKASSFSEKIIELSQNTNLYQKINQANLEKAKTIFNAQEYTNIVMDSYSAIFVKNLSEQIGS